MNRINYLINIFSKRIENLHNQKYALEKDLKCGIIDQADMLNELDMINKKEVVAKRKLVEQVHVRVDGTPKSIRYEASRDLWVTKVNKTIRLHAKTEEKLLDKILEYYDCHLMTYSIDRIFDLAIENKSKTDNCSSLTIKRLKQDYTHFITDEFGSKDIRKVSKDDLKAYTNEMTSRLYPTNKAFYRYKGVLNLIWGYAIEYDYVQTDIVKAIVNYKYRSKCNNAKPKNYEKILSVEDISRIQFEVHKRMRYPRYGGYFIHGYMILLSIETGMRAAELCALKWSDIDEKNIHIHAQQLTQRDTGNRDYYYAPWTKDEKGISRGGRMFPITDNIAKILNDLKALQEGKHIVSEYVFCDVYGDWIKISAYHSCLRRFMKSMQFAVTNNHAFRMSLNSNILIPRGIPVTERAKLLGHSVETNLRHYSYARIGVEDEIRNLLNGEVAPKLSSNIINFEDNTKEKSLRTLSS